MSLQRKSFLVLGIALLAIMLLALTVVRAGMLRDFTELEHEAVERDIIRMRSVIEREIDGIDALTLDWSHWDDTYAYVQGEDDEYEGTNFVGTTLENIDMNMIVVARSEGESIFTLIDRGEGSDDSIPPEELVEGLASGRLVPAGDPEANTSGVLVSGGESWLLGVRPILDSNATGPAAGTLVMGRLMDSEWVTDLGSLLDTEVRLDLLGDNAAPEEVSLGVEALDEESVVGWTIITDVDGTAVARLSVVQPRTIYARGQASVRLVLAAILLTGLAFVLTSGGLMSRLVLQPVAALAEAVDRARVAGDDELDLLAHSDDELGRLTDNVHALFEERSSQRKAIEARTLQLSVARDQALDALRLRTQTLANLSHDARTPLNVIQLSAEAMAEGVYGDVNPKLAKPIERIRLGCRQLLTFANNLLEESKSIATSQVKPQFEDVVVREILHEVSVLMKPLAERKDLILSSKVTSEVPQSVRCDRERVVQILINLVENAIKFTDTGEVSMHVSQPDPMNWIIVVQDSGPGIPEADRKRIFGPFWQQDASMTRSANRGVGLGLYVVRELSKALGGTIEVGDAELGGAPSRYDCPWIPKLWRNHEYRRIAIDSRR